MMLSLCKRPSQTNDNDNLQQYYKIVFRFENNDYDLQHEQRRSVDCFSMRNNNDDDDDRWTFFDWKRRRLLSRLIFSFLIKLQTIDTQFFEYKRMLTYC